jgi:hypothetical protein
MDQELWQHEAGTPRRTATVPGASELGVSASLGITVAVSDKTDLRSQASYMQLVVPGVGPVLAWVGVPGGGQREGCYIHPQSGRTWPWGQKHHAVKYAVDFVQERTAGAGSPSPS